MESIHNSSYMYELNNVIDYVSENRTPQEIEELFEMLRSKAESEFVKRDNCKDKGERVNYALSGLAYFCLTEALNENSSFSEKIVNDIKEKYGDKYLDIIQKIDNEYLSVDGKKVKNEEHTELPRDEEMQKYLIMKRWQDKQRTYSFKRIRPMYPQEKEYIDEDEPNLMVLHKKTLVKRAIEEMKREKLIPIETVAKYIECGLENEMTKFVGGKAVGLAKLFAEGINIPTTYVIPVGLDIGNRDIMQKLNKTKKYAFRSSADIEDGGEHSFAGMFDSCLNVSLVSAQKAINKVKKSVNNDRVKKYIEMNNISSVPNMAVVVQEFREPEISGVWIGSGIETGVLEWVEGNGEKLVSGKSNPNRIIYEAENIKSEKRKEAIIEIGKKLSLIQKRLSTKTNKPADMEWCLLDGKLVLLQYRPVTKEIILFKDNMKENQENVNYINSIVKGSPASKGEIKGKAKYLRSPEEAKDWEDGNILMANFTDPDWMDTMTKCSGLITAHGGLLCHSAIIARELGIPCVTGIGSKAMKVYRNEMEMYLNGTTGEVCTAKLYDKLHKKKDNDSKEVIKDEKNSCKDAELDK